MHDALCVLKTVVNDSRAIYGGGCSEVRATERQSERGREGERERGREEERERGREGERERGRLPSLFHSRRRRQLCERRHTQLY